MPPNVEQAPKLSVVLSKPACPSVVYGHKHTLCCCCRDMLVRTHNPPACCVPPWQNHQAVRMQHTERDMHAGELHHMVRTVACDSPTTTQGHSPQNSCKHMPSKKMHFESPGAAQFSPGVWCLPGATNPGHGGDKTQGSVVAQTSAWQRMGKRNTALAALYQTRAVIRPDTTCTP